jgi:UDP-glucose 4-epimerase
VIDDLSTGYKKNIDELIHAKKIRFIKGSICNLNLLKNIFSKNSIIFHQAAIPSVPRSIKDPISSNDTNITGTLNVLVAAKQAEVKKVIYASSSSVYGDTPILPKIEDMNPNPLSPYAVNKLTAEYYCQIFSRLYHLPTISLRYFNVFGPFQDPNGAYAAVIPKFIKAISEGKPPVIFGDGLQTRDFTFVQNVVDINILAAENINVTGVFNVACGKRITILDLAKKIMDIIKIDTDIRYETPRPGDILHSLADISKARNILHYTPSINIKKGLEETITWFQKKNY